jgi:hypothetical protein
MLDGLGLAETTPGPLIIVTQFVGFLGGYLQSCNTSIQSLYLSSRWLKRAPRIVYVLTEIDNSFRRETRTAAESQAAVRAGNVVLNAKLATSLAISNRGNYKTLGLRDIWFCPPAAIQVPTKYGRGYWRLFV